MIGRLTGKVLECSPNELLLDVGGVGYALSIPLSTFYTIGQTGRDGPVSLHVHTHVREDSLQLFGFATPLERATFELLIAISGVGPKLAIAILSGIGAEELAQAVYEQDRARLQKIPGVGRKTAERVLLELRDKMAADREGEPPGGATAAPGDAREGGGSRHDAISALLNLGYSRDAAARAVDGALEQLPDTAGLEPLLRAALSRIVG